MKRIIRAGAGITRSFVDYSNVSADERRLTLRPVDGCVINDRIRYKPAGPFKGFGAPPIFVAKPSAGFYVPFLPRPGGY